MQQTKTNWTKNEFMAYLFFYCANVDLNISTEEKTKILAYAEKDTFKKIYTEFKGDNDYQSIQKIKNGFEQFKYSSSELEKLLSEMKSLFISDGEYSQLEQFLFNQLQKVFK